MRSFAFLLLAAAGTACSQHRPWSYRGTLFTTPVTPPGLETAEQRVVGLLTEGGYEIRRDVQDPVRDPRFRKRPAWLVADRRSEVYLDHVVIFRRSPPGTLADGLVSYQVMGSRLDDEGRAHETSAETQRDMDRLVVALQGIYVRRGIPPAISSKGYVRTVLLSVPGNPAVPPTPDHRAIDILIELRYQVLSNPWPLTGTRFRAWQSTTDGGCLELSVDWSWVSDPGAVGGSVMTASAYRYIVGVARFGSDGREKPVTEADRVHVDRILAVLQAPQG